MKRIGSVALLLALGLGIFGCGGTAETTTTPTPPAETAKPADAPGGPAETP